MIRRLLVVSIVEDIKKGLTFDQLMKKYELSDDALRKVMEGIATAYAKGQRDIAVDD